MGDFRSFQSSRRAAATPMQPVIDPAGWSPDDLRDVARWSYSISERDADELAGGIREVRRRGIPIVAIKVGRTEQGQAMAQAHTRKKMQMTRKRVRLGGTPLGVWVRLRMAWTAAVMSSVSDGAGYWAAGDEGVT